MNGPVTGRGNTGSDSTSTVSSIHFDKLKSVTTVPLSSYTMTKVPPLRTPPTDSSPGWLTTNASNIFFVSALSSLSLINTSNQGNHLGFESTINPSTGVENSVLATLPKSDLNSVVLVIN